MVWALLPGTRASEEELPRARRHAWPGSGWLPASGGVGSGENEEDDGKSSNMAAQLAPPMDVSQRRFLPILPLQPLRELSDVEDQVGGSKAGAP